MAIPSFYHPQLTDQQGELELDQKEAAHAIKSRRLGVGQAVRVFNGKGLLGFGHISSMTRREVTIEIDSWDQHVSPKLKLSVAVAVPKGDRQKVMVDMLTQLGVSEIIPMRCQRSITRFNAQIAEKWQRVAVEACKQSQNPCLPKIANELSLEVLLEQTQRQFVFADADGLCPTKIALESSEITVLIGPEGGFSDIEIAKLCELSVPSMRIGEYILRTETAAIAAASTLSLCG